MRVVPGREVALGVRHQAQHASARVADAGDVERRAVGVVGVAAGDNACAGREARGDQAGLFDARLRALAGDGNADDLEWRPFAQCWSLGIQSSCENFVKHLPVCGGEFPASGFDECIAELGPWTEHEDVCF